MKAIKNQLPQRRKCENVQVKIGDQNIHLTTSEYPDGNLVEIFINVDNDGDYRKAAEMANPYCIRFSSAMGNLYCIRFSKSLQTGTPLEELVDELLHTRFQPYGVVQGHDQITSCSSVMDFVAKHVAIKYLGRTDLIQKQAANVDA